MCASVAQRRTRLERLSSTFENPVESNPRARIRDQKRCHGMFGISPDDIKIIIYLYLAVHWH